MRGTRKNRQAKAKQASKLEEIRAALMAAGFDTAAKQAIVLRVGRSTAWALLNRDKGAGLRQCDQTHSFVAGPSGSRATKVEEYVKEKGRGLYGHSELRSEAFSDQFPDLT